MILMRNFYPPRKITFVLIFSVFFLTLLSIPFASSQEGTLTEGEPTAPPVLDFPPEIPIVITPLPMPTSLPTYNEGALIEEGGQIVPAQPQYLPTQDETDNQRWAPVLFDGSFSTSPMGQYWKTWATPNQSDIQAQFQIDPITNNRYLEFRRSSTGISAAILQETYTNIPNGYV
jgi:hypothetical protein